MSGEGEWVTRVQVGFVGLGNMGAPMARNLVAAGHDVAGYDVVAVRIDELVEAGGRAAASPADAARGADVVSIVVLDDAQLDGVTAGPDGVLAGTAAGTVVAVHSTVHPDTVVAVAAAAPDGVDVLDAPVSGGVPGARDASLAIMVGGDADVFARAKPALDAMGSFVVHLGPLGAGLGAKLARNLIGYIMYLAAQEGRRLAEAADVDLEALVQILEHTGGGNPVMQHMLLSTGDELSAADLQPIVELAAKDLRVTLDVAASLGLDLPATRVTLDHVDDAMGQRRAAARERGGS
ncbi:MAG: NAD(P)-dependent oxidoreductase [Acidimicrobiia bacterium]